MTFLLRIHTRAWACRLVRDYSRITPHGMPHTSTYPLRQCCMAICCTVGDASHDPSFINKSTTRSRPNGWRHRFDACSRHLNTLHKPYCRSRQIKALGQRSCPHTIRHLPHTLAAQCSSTRFVTTCSSPAVDLTSNLVKQAHQTAETARQPHVEWNIIPQTCLCAVLGKPCSSIARMWWHG